MKNNTSATVTSSSIVQWTPTAAVEKLIEKEAARRGVSYQKAARVLGNEALESFIEDRITVKLPRETMTLIRAEAKRQGCSVQEVVDRNCPPVLKVWLPELFELDKAKDEHRMPRETSLTVYEGRQV